MFKKVCSIVERGLSAIQRADDYCCDLERGITRGHTFNEVIEERTMSLYERVMTTIRKEKNDVN